MTLAMTPAMTPVSTPDAVAGRCARRGGAMTSPAEGGLIGMHSHRTPPATR